MDDAIPAYPIPATGVAVRRINKGNSSVGHQSSNSATAQKVLEFGQLGAGIDAGNLARVLMLKEREAVPFGFQDRRDVGQIVFTLAINGTHTLKGREQLIRVKAVDARVDLANLSLVVVTVPLLDGLKHVTGFVRHDPTISGWILQANCQNCASGGALLMRFDEHAQSFSPHQRNITGKNQNG